MTGYLPTADYRNDSPLYPDATLDQKKYVNAKLYVDEKLHSHFAMQIVKGEIFFSNANRFFSACY